MTPEERATKVELPDIDPTKNVLDLVEAKSKHVFDVVEAERRRINDIMVMRNQLRAAEFDRVRAEAQLRADYDSKLAAKEKERLDAIRVIDGNNLNAAVDRAAAEARTLANAVEQSAERNRSALADLEGRINNRVHQVEDFQSKMIGRQGLSTPLVAVMAAISGALLGFFINLIYTAVSHFKG